LKIISPSESQKNCNDNVTKDPATPQVCRYRPTTRKMSFVLKRTIVNKTTSVTTHFKKLTIGNNVFIDSVIV